MTQQSERIFLECSVTPELYRDREALAAYAVDAIDKWAAERGYEPSDEADNLRIHRIPEMETSRLIEVVIFRRYVKKSIAGAEGSR